MFHVIAGIFFTLIMAAVFATHPREEKAVVNEIGEQKMQLLLTTLYVDKCTSDNFTTYRTPIGDCYNGKHFNTTQDFVTISSTLWSTVSNPYGDHDIIDELVTENNKIVWISRSFYKSTNGTCMEGITDSFPNIPLYDCVGPFGEPFPWGILKLITSINNEVSTMI